MKKKLLVLTPYLDLNGAEIALLDYLNHPDTRDLYEVCLISGYRGRLAYKTENFKKCIYLHESTLTFKNKVLKRLINIDLEEKVFAKTIKSFKPDICIINTCVFPRFSHLFKYTDCPTLLYVHELHDRLKLLETNYLDQLFAQSSTIICSSKLVKKQLLEHHNVHGEVLYPSVNFEGLYQVEDVAELLHWISVGNLDDNKNPSLFIDIALQALNLNPNYTFTWIGGDKETDYFKRLVNEIPSEYKSKINFVGWQTDQYQDYVNRADGFICCSGFESFGISCIEAAYRGVPVVSSRCGGPEEALPNITYFVNDISAEQYVLLLVKAQKENHSNLIRERQNKAMSFHIDKLAVEFTKHLKTLCYE